MKLFFLTFVLLIALHTTATAQDSWPTSVDDANDRIMQETIIARTSSDPLEQMRAQDEIELLKNERASLELYKEMDASNQRADDEALANANAYEASIPAMEDLDNARIMYEDQQFRPLGGSAR
jgi:Skp family chaperone for outer membrane proteins